MLKFISDVLKRDKKNEKGFSLVELIVVVAILGILVAIAIPVYGAIQTTARHNAIETAAANAATSMASQIAQGVTGNDALDVVKGKAPSGYDITASAPTTAPDDAKNTLTASGTYNDTTDNVLVVAQNTTSKEYAWAGTSDAGKGNTWTTAE